MKTKKESRIKNQESSTVCEKRSGMLVRDFSSKHLVNTLVSCFLYLTSCISNKRLANTLVSCFLTLTSCISSKRLARTLVSCFLILASCISLSSCGSDDDETIAPKPRAYFRLTFPEKKYVMYDSACPFKFEMPAYAKMVKDPHPGAEPCWLNLDFPSLNATLHLSYESVNATNLGSYLQNTYELVSKHEIKASGIQEEVVSKDKQKVYGLIYDIGGNAASRIQFFLTDSTSNFIRGALYFNAVPNNDSIKPCVDFIKKDIYHMVETFQWKNNVVKPVMVKPMVKPAPVSKPSK